MCGYTAGSISTMFFTMDSKMALHSESGNDSSTLCPLSEHFAMFKSIGILPVYALLGRCIGSSVCISGRCIGISVCVSSRTIGDDFKLMLKPFRRNNRHAYMIWIKEDERQIKMSSNK